MPMKNSEKLLLTLCILLFACEAVLAVIIVFNYLITKK